VDHAGTDAAFDERGLPSRQQRGAELAERYVVEPRRDVDAVDLGVAVPRGVSKHHRVFGGPPLRDPFSERRSAASRELLNGDRTELLSTLNLAVPGVGVLLEGEHARSVGVVLPPADLPSACAVLSSPRPDAHSASLPFRRLAVALAGLRVLAPPRRSSPWVRAGPTSAPCPRLTRRTRCCAAPSSASRMP
jgi:hypothetical protein